MTDQQQHLALAETWAPARGPLAWFSQIDHRTIGIRFIVTAFVWFAFAGLLALLMRIQLAKPNNTFLSSDQYNQFFTVHGITMMFLFAVPVMLAVAIYVALNSGGEEVQLRDVTYDNVPESVDAMKELVDSNTR